MKKMREWSLSEGEVQIQTLWYHIPMDITETYHPNDQKAWRQWLETHHDKKKEIWVVFYKKHTGKATMTYQDAVDEALCFRWIDGMEKRIDDQRYGLRFTPRAKASKWSQTNVARYRALLKEGRMTAGGTAAFDRKTHVYTAMSTTKGATAWHVSHKNAQKRHTH